MTVTGDVFCAEGHRTRRARPGEKIKPCGCVVEHIREDGLTYEEGIVADALVAAVNAFAKLERQHPDELRDFVDGIHKCQDQLAFRIVRRDYPKGWPTYNEETR